MRWSVRRYNNAEPNVTGLGLEFSINELITNLLFNSVKYTPENKSVHHEAKSHDDSVQIEIADTGIGIPANELGNVFEEFFRARNAKKREKDGTGLGLSEIGPFPSITLRVNSLRSGQSLIGFEIGFNWVCLGLIGVEIGFNWLKLGLNWV
ncbi:MAG: ATP-binding protein [Phycisphaerae bacterium]